MSRARPTKYERQCLQMRCTFCYAPAGVWCIQRSRPRDALFPAWVIPPRLLPKNMNKAGVLVIPKGAARHSRPAELLHRAREPA